MGLRELETAILSELREVVGSSTLKKKDILAWNTGEVEVLTGETKFFLPSLKVNVVILSATLPKPKVSKVKAVK